MFEQREGRIEIHCRFKRSGHKLSSSLIEKSFDVDFPFHVDAVESGLLSDLFFALDGQLDQLVGVVAKLRAKNVLNDAYLFRLGIPKDVG